MLYRRGDKFPRFSIFYLSDYASNKDPQFKFPDSRGDMSDLRRKKRLKCGFRIGYLGKPRPLKFGAFNGQATLSLLRKTDEFNRREIRQRLSMFVL
jgi:hypothetical protein